MSVLPPQWPPTPPPWYGFSALAAPAIPTFSPPHSPTPHGHSGFSAMGHPMAIQHRYSPPSSSSPFGSIPPKNMRALDRDALHGVLEFFSTRIPIHFGTIRPIRLVIHGGAVMLLNAELNQLAVTTAATDAHSARQRSTTRDIDCILRTFASEWASYGVHDGSQRLKQCILETAAQFGLGADWMNSDADVALPMATNPATGALYDPIHSASMQSADSLTVFVSQNGMLHLVSVTPYWTVALKMVRFNAADREDICILLRLGIRARGIHWTPARLELWLLGQAWAMGYTGYDPQRIATMRKRMVEVVDEVNRWDPEAVMDDGRGGFLPLRPSSSASGVYQPRVASPFYSPQAYAPPFVPQQQQQPPVVPEPSSSRRHKKDKKRKETTTATTAVTTWPNAWTSMSSPYGNPYASTSNVTPYIPPPSSTWDPREPARWAENVRRAAEKEKRNGRMASWLPFKRRSKDAQEELEQWENIGDNESLSSGSDSDSTDGEESWLEERRRTWGTSGRLPRQRRRRTRTPVRTETAASDASFVRMDAGSTPMPMPQPFIPGIQNSIASFMSGGMDREPEPTRSPTPRRHTRALTATTSAPLIPVSKTPAPYVPPPMTSPRSLAHSRSMSELSLPLLQPHYQPPQRHTLPVPLPPRVHPNNPWTYWNQQQIQRAQAAISPPVHDRAPPPSGINGPSVDHVAGRMGRLGLYG